MLQDVSKKNLCSTNYEGVAESYEALKALGLALPPGAKKKERRNVEL